MEIDNIDKNNIKIEEIEKEIKQKEEEYLENKKIDEKLDEEMINIHSSFKKCINMISNSMNGSSVDEQYESIYNNSSKYNEYMSTRENNDRLKYEREIKTLKDMKDTLQKDSKEEKD